MSQQQEIADRMAALRATGTATAERLPAAWQRATDWHEYVRAYPWQAVGAAVAVGYLMIPKRRQAAATVSAAVAAGRAGESSFVGESSSAGGASPVSATTVRLGLTGGRAADARTAPTDRAGLLHSVTAPLRPWLVGLATQAAQRVLMNQIQQFSYKLFHDVSAPSDAQQSSEPQPSQRSRQAGVATSAATGEDSGSHFGG